MRQRFPEQLTGARLSMSGEFEPLFSEGLHGGPCRTGTAKSFKEVPERVLHLVIRIQHDPLRRILTSSWVASCCQDALRLIGSALGAAAATEQVSGSCQARIQADMPSLISTVSHQRSVVIKLSAAKTCSRSCS